LIGLALAAGNTVFISILTVNNQHTNGTFQQVEKPYTRTSTCDFCQFWLRDITTTVLQYM